MSLALIYLVRLIAEWMKLHKRTHENLNSHIKRLEDMYFKLDEQIRMRR
jgi:hypothetical protein